jgi:hypothetical protein
MLESGQTQRRINISYFEGVNALVSFNVGSNTEFVHAENARSKVVGTVEKREGQTVLGTTTASTPFVTSANYGIFFFQNDNNLGLYRISNVVSSSLSINVSDYLFLFDVIAPKVSMSGLIDSYGSSNRTADIIVKGGSSFEYIGQSFTNNNDIILSQAQFSLSKLGNPTGNAYFQIYAHSGTYGTNGVPTGSPLVSIPFSLVPLSTTPIVATINLGSNGILLKGGVKYFANIWYHGGDGSNYLKVGVDNTSPAASGNFSSSADGVNWNWTVAYDMIFYVSGIGVEDSNFSTLSPLTLGSTEQINLSEQVNNLDAPVSGGKLATVYYINSARQWVPLSGGGSNIIGGTFDYAYAEGCVFLVNLQDRNRYIKSDGTTVVDSSDGTGHLYNTPNASVVNYYKSRLYLGDFIQSGVRYKTTVLRSSYAMGIISLFNNDYLHTDTDYASGMEVDVTDTNYLYADAGANTYDIYRGPTLISTITVTKVNQTSIVATWTGTPDFHASDEIWVSGTYLGAKVFRWIDNPTVTGKDIKQYDTFKLAGGASDSITMLTNIGNVMLISNKNSIASWNDYTLENFDLDVGCVSKKGYIKAAGTLYFLHYTGVYSTTGSTPSIISNKVQPYITGATKSGKESCAAGKKGLNIFFTLGDVTLYKGDGSINKILKDVCLEYNLIQQNWYVHTNVKASEFATFVEESDSDRLEFTDTAGNHAVKEFLSGDTDDGDEIHFRVDTMKLTTGIQVYSRVRSMVAFEYSTKPLALYTEVERGNSIQAFINLENGEEYYPLEGQISKGLSVIKIHNKDDSRGKPPTCRLLSISLRDSSKQRCKISRMTLIYVPTTDEKEDNEPI